MKKTLCIIVMLAIMQILLSQVFAQSYVYVVVGTGSGGYSGDGGPATAAELAWPENITFDKCDNLYISHGLDSSKFHHL